MQTFLPYDNFEESAKCLDRMRLGKQRVEALQIVRTLWGEYKESNAWANHPAVKMWEGCDYFLVQYGITICEEWIRRGYNDNLLPEFIQKLEILQDSVTREVEPSWLGYEEFHASHRSNLLRKNPTWYGQFGWTEPDDIPYFWPTKVWQRC